MSPKKTETFESALEGLEQSVNALKKNDITLDEALASFEQGMKYYDKCAGILDGAKQKIEVYQEKAREKQL